MQENQEGIHYEIQKNCLIIYVGQDLDHHAVTCLRERSDRLIAAGNIRHVVFDFGQVTFMDSSGIGLIMGRYKKVLFQGGKVAVCRVGNEVDRIFRMSGLYQIMDKYATPSEAIQGMGRI